MHIVTCVRVGKEIKVKVEGSNKYVQFPKDLREEGKSFVVDSLKDMKTHYSVVGQIYEMRAIGGKSLNKSTKEDLSESYIEFREANDHEGETWLFFVKKSNPQVQNLMALFDRYKNVNDDGAFSYREISEKEVKTLCKREGSSGYFSEFNLVKEIKSPKEVDNSLPKSIDKITTYDQMLNYLYKAGCFEF